MSVLYRKKSFLILAFFQKNKTQVTITLFCSILLIFALYLPYYLMSKIHGTRSMVEIQSMAPTLVSWFSATPYSFLYSGLNFLSESKNQNWWLNFFSAFTPYLIMFPFCLLAIKKINYLHSKLGICICLFLSSIILTLLITTWVLPDRNLWLWAVEMIKPFRAIRAFGRISILLFVIQVISLSIVLNYYLLKYRQNKIIRICIKIIPLVFMLECISIGQPFYSKFAAQERIKSITKQIKSYECEAFIFAPGNVEQPWLIHLDAWDASLKTGIPCLNGYSGLTPKSHVKFLTAPTKKNAQELIAKRKLDPAKILIIENRGEELERKYPMIRYDLQNVVLKTEVKAIKIQSGHELSIDCTIHNPTLLNIPARKLNFHPSYRCYTEDDELLEGFEAPRSYIENIQASKTMIHKLKIIPPKDPGNYIIKLSFVRETVSWRYNSLPSSDIPLIKLKVIAN